MVAHNCKSWIYLAEQTNAVSEFLTLTSMDHLLICYYHENKASRLWGIKQKKKKKKKKKKK